MRKTLFIAAALLGSVSAFTAMPAMAKLSAAKTVMVGGVNQSNGVIHVVDTLLMP